MERKAIHEQIATLLDKINHLNNNVKDGTKLHSVEVDLFLGYLKELQDAILKLTEFESRPAAKTETAVTPVSKTVVQPEPAPQQPKEELQVAPQKAKIEKPAETPVNVATVETAEEKVIEPIVTKEEKIIPAKQEKTTNEKPAANAKKESTLNDRFKKESTELGEKLKKGSRKKLKESIDLAQRYVYINELFAGDAERFNKSLKELEQCQSVEDAMSYLQNLETTLPWKEKSKFAKQFKDSVLMSLEN